MIYFTPRWKIGRSLLLLSRLDELLINLFRDRQLLKKVKENTRSAATSVTKDIKPRDQGVRVGRDRGLRFRKVGSDKRNHLFERFRKFTFTYIRRLLIHFIQISLSVSEGKSILLKRTRSTRGTRTITKRDMWTSRTRSRRWANTSRDAKRGPRIPGKTRRQRRTSDRIYIRGRQEEQERKRKQQRKEEAQEKEQESEGVRPKAKQM